jgi:hypothetical protein
MDPVLANLNQEKGLAKEALTNVLDLLSFEEEDLAGLGSGGQHRFADRLLEKWMQLHEMAQISGSSQADFQERMLRESIIISGKKDPKVS